LIRTFLSYRLLRCSSRNGTLSMKTKPALLEDEFIDMKFITRLTGLSDKWFYKLIQEGVFPKPIKMGRASRWLKSDLEEWLQAKINDSRN
ncbi:transcriptional family, partial [Citrobacter sp. A1]